MENNERIISNEAEETRILLELFFKGNYSDKELERITGIPSTTIGRRLTDLNNYKELYNHPENMFDYVMSKRKNNSLEGKKLGSQMALLNNSENPKINLGILFKNKDMQLKFLKHLILTYRIKRPLVNELFVYEEDPTDMIFEKNRNNELVTHALNYVNIDPFDDQLMVKEKVVSYIKDLLTLRKENKEEYIKKIYEVTDKNAMEIRNKHTLDSKYDNEEFLEIVKFHIKYAMNYREVASVFLLNSNSYKSRLERLLEKNPELKNEYKNIAEYNMGVQQFNRRTGYGNR